LIMIDPPLCGSYTLPPPFIWRFDHRQNAGVGLLRALHLTSVKLPHCTLR
jgi:hypothetical protein